MPSCHRLTILAFPNQPAGRPEFGLRSRKYRGYLGGLSSWNA
jgi:hypothetical protein